MNVIFPRQLSLLLSMAALAIVGTGLSAQAQTNNVGSTDNSVNPSIGNAQPTPTPGTTATSAAALTQVKSPTPRAAAATPKVAQVGIDPGQPTRGGSSYIGIAANIGLGGESDLGDSNFTVISKVGITNAFSIRPSAVIGNDPVFLVPVTFDFSIQPIDAFSEAIPISPYVGGGVAISTGDNDDVGPLITAGVDYPFSSRFTATAAVNVGFLEDTDVGLILGVGYNFGGFGF